MDYEDLTSKQILAKFGRKLSTQEIGETLDYNKGGGVSDERMWGKNGELAIVAGVVEIYAPLNGSHPDYDKKTRLLFVWNGPCTYGSCYELPTSYDDALEFLAKWIKRQHYEG